MRLAVHSCNSARAGAVSHGIVALGANARRAVVTFPTTVARTDACLFGIPELTPKLCCTLRDIRASVGRVRDAASISRAVVRARLTTAAAAFVTRVALALTSVAVARTFRRAFGVWVEAAEAAACRNDAVALSGPRETVWALTQGAILACPARVANALVRRATRAVARAVVRANSHGTTDCDRSHEERKNLHC